MSTRDQLGGTHNSRGLVLVHQDWYEFPDEPDPLRRNAIVTTLNPDAFPAPAGAELIKRGYQILEPIDALPYAFTICDCRPVGEPYGTFEDARDYLHDRGIKHPHFGFNPLP